MKYCTQVKYYSLTDLHRLFDHNKIVKISLKTYMHTLNKNEQRKFEKDHELLHM